MIHSKQPIPDTEVTISDGSIKRLSDFWGTQKVVLAFLRHLGWVFCREQVAQLRRAKERFDQAGARVVLVGMGTVEQTAAFKVQFDLPFVMLSDPKRELHQSLGIGFMTLASTFSPQVIYKTASALMRGHGIGVPYGDIRQLPAVFIIDTHGRIQSSYYGRNAADHPGVEEILKML